MAIAVGVGVIVGVAVGVGTGAGVAVGSGVGVAPVRGDGEHCEQAGRERGVAKAQRQSRESGQRRNPLAALEEALATVAYPTQCEPARGRRGPCEMPERSHRSAKEARSIDDCGKQKTTR